MRIRLLCSLFAASVALPLFAQVPAGGDLPPVKQITMVRKLVPVYPFDELVKGKTGWAEVRFMVDYSGRPIMTTVAASSNPVFGRSLLAEIESNEFMPPRVNGQPQITLSGERYSFNGEANLDPSEKRILAELRKPMPALSNSRELDKALTPIRRDAPTFPSALLSEGVSGKVELEFVVDRDGRAMFPRIVSSSHEDFGWAAAAAISRWRYQPPVKGGAKVDTRANVTVTFDSSKGTVQF